VADREEISSRDSELRFKGFSRSRMVQLLVIRAREVAEMCKAFRYAKMENVQLGILLEPLLARKSDPALMTEAHMLTERRSTLLERG
jgi:hypothetical protein